VSAKRGDVWRVFGVPALLGVLSLGGLVAALAGDGFFDVVSWVGLGVPVFVVAYFIARASGSRRVN
jgi:hypothetical protein